MIGHRQDWQLGGLSMFLAQPKKATARTQSCRADSAPDAHRESSARKPNAFGSRKVRRHLLALMV
jgi:hypothetical protein